MLNVSVLIFMIGACVVSTAVGQTANITVPGKILIQMSVDRAANLLTVKAEASTTGYIAFGISPQSVDGENAMTGADIIVAGFVNGTGYVRDYKAIGAQPPTLDTLQNAALLNASETEGRTTVEFTRPLESPDTTNDINITAGQLNFIWATGAEDAYANGSIAYHTPENRGEAPITLWERDPDPVNITVPGKIHIQMSVDGAANLLRVKAEASTTGYIAFGISPQSVDGENAMTGADIIVAGFVNGTGYIRDYKADGPHAPTLDTLQNAVLVSASETEGRTMVEFTRPLESPDTTNDINIAAGLLNFIWAFGAEDAYANGSIAYHTPENRGEAPINLWESDSGTTANPGDDNSGSGSKLPNYTFLGLIACVVLRL